MKKFFIAVVAICAVLVLCLTGCSSKIKNDTVATTQTKWDNATIKQSTDTFTIKNLNFSKLIIVNDAVINLKRKFTKDSTTIDLSLDEISVTFAKRAESFINLAISMLPKELGIDINFKQLVEIINNFESLNISITLTENNTKLDYHITSKINYRTPTYDIDKTGSITIDYKTPYGENIKQAIALLTSHYSAVFEPIAGGEAKINPEKLNNLTKSLIDYAASADPNTNSSAINAMIKNILGVSYTQFVSDKIKINNTTSKVQISGGYIKTMNIGYNNIQILYNKTQFSEMVSKLIEFATGTKLPANTIENSLTDVTENVSCLELERLAIKSNYKIKK